MHQRRFRSIGCQGMDQAYLKNENAKPRCGTHILKKENASKKPQQGSKGPPPLRPSNGMGTHTNAMVAPMTLVVQDGPMMTFLVEG